MNTLQTSETRAVLGVAVLAAFSDGQKHERERTQLRQIAEGLSADASIGMPMLVQDILMKRVTLESLVPELVSSDARQLAYEMALCVCEADGARSEPEQAFLADLQRRLALDTGQADAFSTQASGWAETAPATAAAGAAGAGSAASTLPSLVPEPARTSSVDAAALDKQILQAAILNGALELLPESLSTMAIIPLQMRLVYQVGKAHGYELDSGHIKDFLATAGVGLTSQYLEQAGRKLLTGVLQRMGAGRSAGMLGGMLGSVIGGVGRQAISSGMSFVSTYALGHLAKRYYAGGRTLSAQLLKSTYQDIAQQAQGLYQQHLPAIQERARTLDAQQVMAMVRGGR
jgi:tellurite resistance protein/uncharacterized protein (DUF697 family)